MWLKPLNVLLFVNGESRISGDPRDMSCFRLELFERLVKLIGEPESGIRSLFEDEAREERSGLLRIQLIENSVEQEFAQEEFVPGAYLACNAEETLVC